MGLSSGEFAEREKVYAIPGDFLGNGSTQFMMVVANSYLGVFSVAGVSVNIGQFKRVYLTDINGNGKQELMCITNDNITKFYEYSRLIYSIIRIEYLWVILMVMVIQIY